MPATGSTATEIACSSADFDPRKGLGQGAASRKQTPGLAMFEQSCTLLLLLADNENLFLAVKPHFEHLSVVVGHDGVRVGFGIAFFPTPCGLRD
jgi:hypothetical protein